MNRNPPPPEDLVDALHDPVHKDLPWTRAAKSMKVIGRKDFRPEIHMRFRDRNDLTTPKHFIDLLVEHLGPVDLDPCSNPWSVVGAGRSFSIQEGVDGLSQEWPVYVPEGAHVFVNSPRGCGQLKKWVGKIQLESSWCCISLLVPLCPTAKWCHELYGLKPHVFALKARLVYGGETVTNSRTDQLCLVGPWRTHKVQSLALSGHFWYMGQPSGSGIFHATKENAQSRQDLSCESAIDPCILGG